MKRIENSVTISNAKLIFRNFKGEGSKYNREGNRNFGCIIPDNDIAMQLMSDGWNVKRLAAREEGDEDTYWIKINIGYGKGKDPRIVIVHHENGAAYLEDLTERNVSKLDDLSGFDIENIDIEFTPYNWTGVNGDGVTAYLKTMFIEKKPESLSSKYDNLPSYEEYAKGLNIDFTK